MNKIETSQSKDGSWAAGGWAPVLQSAQMSTAMEQSQLAGRRIDEDKLALARGYQKRQVAIPAATAGASGPAPGPSPSPAATSRLTDSAGVALYSSAANMRGVAAEARAAADLVEEAKKAGKAPADAKVDVATLEAAGVSNSRANQLNESFQMNAAAKQRSFDDRLLSGFGNNGGEEFLSYQMKSESLAIDGGEEWTKFRSMMDERLAKVQNPDGSWSGHHCITSPVFCTATAISCLTADRDVAWLQRAGRLAGK
jgi:hypothetical protein